MYYLVFATDKPDSLPLRQAVRPRHREYLRKPHEKVQIVHAGPTLSGDAGSMNGTLLIVEAEKIEDVQEFVMSDPYQSVDLFETIIVRPWSWSLGQPGAVNDKPLA